MIQPASLCDQISNDVMGRVGKLNFPFVRFRCGTDSVVMINADGGLGDLFCICLLEPGYGQWRLFYTP